MKEKSEDRRFKRTRQLLRSALVDLMVEKRYSGITIQNIVDRAGVGRSTFYSHYRDKDDLLVKGFEPALQAFSALVTVDAAGNLQIMPVTKYFEHAKEQQHVYKALTRGRVIDMMFEKVQEYWSASLEDKIKKSLPEARQTEIPLTVLSNYVAGTFLMLLKWWLNNDMPYSPERMDQMFRQLVEPRITQEKGIA